MNGFWALVYAAVNGLEVISMTVKYICRHILKQKRDDNGKGAKAGAKKSESFVFFLQVR
jgi:hypothetical protein